MTFSALLLSLAERYKTHTAFAQALNISTSELSRAIARNAPFEIGRLLRVALVTGTPARFVLRAAGKSDLVAMIEQLYGDPRRDQPTLEEQALLRVWAALGPSERDAYLRVGQAMAQHRNPKFNHPKTATA